MKQNLVFAIVIAFAMTFGFLFSEATRQPVEASITPLSVLQSTLGQTDVTDPEAIAFLSGDIRPASEQLRGVYWTLKAIKAKAVDGGMLAKFPVGGGIIQDGREAQGVSRVDCDELRVITTFANTYITAYEAAGVGEMQVPCVRNFRVESD